MILVRFSFLFFSNFPFSNDIPINLNPFMFMFAAYMEPDRLTKRYRQKRSTSSGEQHSRSKRAIPHIIYPEILVIVDYDGYRLHGGDNIQVRPHQQPQSSPVPSLSKANRSFSIHSQIKRYFVSFWNGVDLRYRLLKGPRIRISIAGIIISRVSTFFFLHQSFSHLKTKPIKHAEIESRHSYYKNDGNSNYELQPLLFKTICFKN